MTQELVHVKQRSLELLRLYNFFCFLIFMIFYEREMIRENDICGCQGRWVFRFRLPEVILGARLAQHHQLLGEQQVANTRPESFPYLNRPKT